MLLSNFYEYVDRENIDLHLICPKCQNPFVDPVIIQSDHIYCRRCMMQKVTNDSSCRVKMTNPSRNLILELDELLVKCKLCEQTNICRQDFSRHINDYCPKSFALHPTIICSWENLKSTIDGLHEMIQSQSLKIENLQKQMEQQAKEQKSQLTEQMIQQQDLYELVIEEFEEQRVKLENIRNKNQSENNQLVAAHERIRSLEEIIEKLNKKLKILLVNDIPMNSHWSTIGLTVAGGHGEGDGLNQLNCPWSIFVVDDDENTVIIADCNNDRIIRFKRDNIYGEVIAGGNGEGNELDQLNGPSNVLLDKETNDLIICDRHNRRVLRCSYGSNTDRREILIDNIDCFGVTIDHQRNRYISDERKHEVRRYRPGSKHGILVAGGNGQGSNLNQLNEPRYLFVDQQQNIYISDNENHRIIKWNKGAKEGIIVAGGQGKGSSLKHLFHPEGLFVDALGTVYVADSLNHRVVRWSQGATQGDILVGGHGNGVQTSQFNVPTGLCFDREGQLYVADYYNHRIQCFSLDKISI